MKKALYIFWLVVECIVGILLLIPSLPAVFMVLKVVVTLFGLV